MRFLITEISSLAADPSERGITAMMASGRYPSLNATMMGWFKNDLPHVMLAPAMTVSLFGNRGLTADEIEALVTLVCAATVPQ